MTIFRATFFESRKRGAAPSNTTKNRPKNEVITLAQKVLPNANGAQLIRPGCLGHLNAPAASPKKVTKHGI